MITAQFVEMSVPVNNSPIQGYSHPNHSNYARTIMLKLLMVW